MKSFDVIVLGLGGVGSSAVYQIARNGKKVLGIDQYSPPHTFGSSHGDTRITRQAIGEGEQYVEFALRSHELWREIAQATNEELLFPVGGLIIGSLTARDEHRKKGFLQNTIDTAAKFGIPHEILSNSELRTRFPQFNVSPDESAYYEPGAGFVKPEKCITAQLTLAKKFGALLALNEKVEEVIPSPSGDGITIKTSKNSYAAEQVIVSAGPWITSLFPEFSDYFKIMRQVLFWFDPISDVNRFSSKNFPIFIWHFGDSDAGMYGFPAIDGSSGGIKIASEQYEYETTPDTVDRTVSEAEITGMYRRCLSGRLPDISERCVKAVSCLYTVTPDSNFVIQRHPIHTGILIASPCSGHGFKHSAAIGETLAAVVSGAKPAISIDTFVMHQQNF